MAEEYPSIDQIIQWMRYYQESLGEPETKINSIKLLRFNHGFYSVDKPLLKSMIDDFQKIIISFEALGEKPSPLQRVGMQLLLDLVYDPKRYKNDD